MKNDYVTEVSANPYITCIVTAVGSPESRQRSFLAAASGSEIGTTEWGGRWGSNYCTDVPYQVIVKTVERVKKENVWPIFQNMRVSWEIWWSLLDECHFFMPGSRLFCTVELGSSRIQRDQVIASNSGDGGRIDFQWMVSRCPSAFGDYIRLTPIWLVSST